MSSVYDNDEDGESETIRGTIHQLYVNCEVNEVLT
jgi:hypothetical protein